MEALDSDCIGKTLAPLGVPLRVTLDAAIPSAGIGSAFAGWDGPSDRSVAPLELSLAFDPALTGAGPIGIEATGRQLTLIGAGAKGGACADIGQAWCAVSSDYLAAPERLRADVLEPLILFLVARHGRTPIHAAAIKSGDLAILLAGPSGAGKSSLALAADAAGWTVLAEDTAYLQTEPQLRIWGYPGPAHLLPADCPSERGPVRVRNGRLKHAVPLRRQSPGALSAERATVCLLARGAAVALERLNPSEAIRLIDPPEPGFDLLAADISAASERLVRYGAWLLTLSSNPADAIDFLAANLPRLHKTAVT